MNGEMLSLGLQRSLFTAADLLPPGYREADITGEMLERFFPEIPSNSIIFKHGVIVGKPGCGKSELFKARARYAHEKYGDENLNIIYTDDLRVAINMMNTRPVQYLIVDDASKRMSSRAIFEQREILGVFNRLRHHYAELGAKQGIVICEFGWQRWQDLDPGFRDGSSVIFKTNMTSESERRMVIDLIGPTYGGRLDWIWDKIDRGDNKIKGLSIGRIGPKAIDQGGVGYYRHKMATFPDFPKIMLGDEWLDDKGNFINPVNNVDAMLRMHKSGKTHNEIADALKIGRSTVTKALNRAKQPAKENISEQ